MPYAGAHKSSLHVCLLKRTRASACPRHRLDLRDIKVITKGGGTVDDSELIDGLVFDQKASKGGGGPTKVRACMCACVHACMRVCV